MSDDLVKRLRGDVDTYSSSPYYSGICVRLSKAADRIEELEAKLARAEAALVRIANRPPEMIWGEDSEVREAMHDMESVAEATLAELKAEKDTP